jgi:3-oxoacyl-[acyl-carrier-protein] synthase-3
VSEQWQRACLLGSSAYLPTRVISNEMLLGNVQTASHSPETLFKQTGIFERRYALSSQSTSDLATFALEPLVNLLKKHQTALSALIVATTSPDYPSPATANWVHKKLGLGENVHCFDIASSCTSFLSAFRCALGFVHAGGNVAVVAAEVKHKSLAENDMRTRSLFGDGAAGMMLCHSKTVDEAFLFCHVQVDTALAEKIRIPVGGSVQPVTALNVNQTFLTISDPKLTYIHTVKRITSAIEYAWKKREETLAEKGLNAQTTDGLIFVHQANANILKDVKARLAPHIAMRIPLLMGDVGNMVCASLPVLRTRCLELEGQRQKSDLKGHVPTQGRPTVNERGKESVFVIDGAQGTGDPHWRSAVSAENFKSLEEAWSLGRLEHRNEKFIDIWVAAGGGFQTLALLHAKNMGIGT